MFKKFQQNLMCVCFQVEKDEVTKMKKISSSLAKMVKEFWGNIEKVSDKGLFKTFYG